MSEFEEKLNAFLSNPDAMAQVMNLAQSLNLGGGGESQDGKASIVLNGVEAHEMLVDPATGQFVSLRAIGGTNIPKTTVKANAFIQDDVRDESKGLRNVFLEAGEGANFTIR